MVGWPADSGNATKFDLGARSGVRSYMRRRTLYGQYRA
jgi:hypothetical protein